MTDNRIIYDHVEKVPVSERKTENKRDDDNTSNVRMRSDSLYPGKISNFLGAQGNFVCLYTKKGIRCVSSRKFSVWGEYSVF